MPAGGRLNCLLVASKSAHVEFRGAGRHGASLVQGVDSIPGEGLGQADGFADEFGAQDPGECLGDAVVGSVATDQRAEVLVPYGDIL